MLARYKRFRIGLRTLKTAAAVIISMMIVTSYGATTSKLMFAMLGAMAVMGHTFKESLESCFTQILGMLFGALAGVLLLSLPLPSLLLAGIGIVFVITLYNVFHIRFSPSLPCLIVVILCTTPDIQPFSYAMGRFWDTAIGLAVGMLINTFVFPYNNSRQIRATLECLKKEIIAFLEKMFDDDENLPDTKEIARIIDTMRKQLKMFSEQWLLLYLKRNRQQLERFQLLERKVQEIAAHMEVLCQMKEPGRLNKDNWNSLKTCGANIKVQSVIDMETEADIITNYHVSQILTLHQEVVELLKR